MTHEYTTRGTCARKILFEVEDGKVHNVQFINGCSGNTQGVAKLCEGMGRSLFKRTPQRSGVRLRAKLKARCCRCS